MSEVIGSQLTSEMVELVRRPDYRQYGRFLDVARPGVAAGADRL